MELCGTDELDISGYGDIDQFVVGFGLFVELVGNEEKYR